MVRKLAAISALLLAATLIWTGAVGAGPDRAAAPVAAPTSAPGPDSDSPVSVAPDGPASTSISYIDSTVPQCYQNVAAQNECYINWAYISVSTTSPAYITAMTVTVDSRVRAVYQGFFQNSLAVSAAMHGKGFLVPCGAYGAAGDMAWGGSHSFIIQARDTAGAPTANYGSVTCPGIRLIYLPALLKG